MDSRTEYSCTEGVGMGELLLTERGCRGDARNRTLEILTVEDFDVPHHL